MALGISLFRGWSLARDEIGACRTASPQMPVLLNWYTRDDDGTSTMSFPGPGIEDEFLAILVVMVVLQSCFRSVEMAWFSA